MGDCNSKCINALGGKAMVNSPPRIVTEIITFLLRL